MFIFIPHLTQIGLLMCLCQKEMSNLSKKNCKNAYTHMKNYVTNLILRRNLRLQTYMGQWEEQDVDGSLIWNCMLNK